VVSWSAFSPLFSLFRIRLTGGELFDRIVNQFPSGYSERDASRLVRKIISAVQYLHSKGVVHRDLKPENLLFQSPALDSEIKVTDFGLAKILTKDTALRTACGTPSYVGEPVSQPQRERERDTIVDSVGLLQAMRIRCVL
jgi:calcium/calmodulin-dependent protein kinase I